VARNEEAGRKRILRVANMGGLFASRLLEADLYTVGNVDRERRAREKKGRGANLWRQGNRARARGITGWGGVGRQCTGRLKQGRQRINPPMGNGYQEGFPIGGTCGEKAAR